MTRHARKIANVALRELHRARAKGLPPSPIVPPGIKPVAVQPPDDQSPGYSWGFGKYGFNPQPDPPKAYHGYAWGYGKHGFNPQPDPPKSYVGGPRSDPDFPEADPAPAIGDVGIIIVESETIDAALRDVRQSRAQFGTRSSVGVAVIFVPLEEIEELDGKIKHLDGEFSFQLAKRDINTPLGKAWVAFGTQWIPFKISWTAWKFAHVPLLQRSTSEAVFDFHEFEENYNEFRRRFKVELKGQTTTTQQKTGEDNGGPDVVDAAKVLAGGLALAAGVYFAAQLIKKRGG